MPRIDQPTLKGDMNQENSLSSSKNLAFAAEEVQAEYKKTLEVLSLTRKLIIVSERILASAPYRMSRWFINDIVKQILRKENRESPWAPENLERLTRKINVLEAELQFLKVRFQEFDAQGLVANNVSFLEVKKIERQLRGSRQTLVQVGTHAYNDGRDILDSKTFQLCTLSLSFLKNLCLRKLDQLYSMILSYADKDARTYPSLFKSERNAESAHDLSNARVDVVICIHNALEDVRRCIESVVKHTNLKLHRIIFVDDGSDLETRDFIREKSLQLEAGYHRNEEACGFTRALNKGISLGNGDVIVSLNSDTIVGPHWINNLLEALSSHPHVGIVGPFSNAASWQSIPELTNEDGTWKVNSIPEGMNVDEYATCIEQNSIRFFPQLKVLNGFCLMLKRSAYEYLGGFNERDFPKGYGEEDDFLIRLSQTGLEARLADNTYVYHSKSKSFTPEGRTSRVGGAKEKLKELHGKKVLTEIADSMKRNEGLMTTRAWTLEKARKHRNDETLPSAQRELTLCWIQPHLQQVGGIRRVIEMTNFLTQSGHRVSVATPDGEKPDWLPLFAQTITIEEALERSFDVGIISDPDMIESFLDLQADHTMYYHLAAYMLYRPQDEKLEKFYQRREKDIHITNSHWTAEMLHNHYNISHSGVFPGGIDQKLFFPHNAKKTHDIVCYGSDRPHKGTADIIAAAKERSVLKLAELEVSQAELAYNLCRGRVFVSACWHEGFNFCPLEAMSCGIPVVLTDDGGCREFAKSGENCLLVPPKDISAIDQAINTLLTDTKLRKKCIENGLRTASAFTWRKVCSDFLDFLDSTIVLKNSSSKNKSSENKMDTLQREAS